MAPFRASRSTRSGRPGGQSEQEVIDGLPVRQWRLQQSFIDTSDETVAKPEPAHEKPTLWKELPMPKGSDHYAPWCQQMLRLARAGRMLQTQNGAKKESNNETTAEEGVNTEQAAKNAKAGMKRGFAAMRWAQVPKSAEEPEREFLAKRRRGLPPLSGAGVNGNMAAMRKTKVRRVDAAGNAYVWEVLVPEGLTVEGEIKDEVVVQEAATTRISAPAPGTIVEGLGVANEEGVVIAQDSATAPIKRKGPPPRRKQKSGPGRGHKKVTFPEGGVAGASPAAGSQHPSEMGDASEVGATEEGKTNGQHGDEYYEYGEGGDYEDREEGELSPSPETEQQDESKQQDETATNPDSTAADPATASDVAKLKDESKLPEAFTTNAQLEPAKEDPAPTQLPQLDEAIKPTRSPPHSAAETIVADSISEAVPEIAQEEAPGVLRGTMPEAAPAERPETAPHSAHEEDLDASAPNMTSENTETLIEEPILEVVAQPLAQPLEGAIVSNEHLDREEVSKVDSTIKEQDTNMEDTILEDQANVSRDETEPNPEA